MESNEKLKSPALNLPMPMPTNLEFPVNELASSPDALMPELSLPAEDQARLEEDTYVPEAQQQQYAPYSELRAPGQFPDSDEENENGDTMLSWGLSHIPMLKTWVRGNNYHPHPYSQLPGRQYHSEGTYTDTDNHPTESEVDIDTTPDEFDETNDGKENYFTYTPQRSRRRKHWHSGTPLSVPWHRSRKSKPGKVECSFTKPSNTKDHTWNVINASDAPLASAANGKSAVPIHTGNQAGHCNIRRRLQELDELEINTFLRNFSRHTREVRLLGNTQYFSRMPQWSDFVYSDEDESLSGGANQPTFDPNSSDPHRRSKLLLHIDRGLQQLIPEPSLQSYVTVEHPHVHKPNSVAGVPASGPKAPELRRTSSTGAIESEPTAEVILPKQLDHGKSTALLGVEYDLQNEPEVTTRSFTPAPAEALGSVPLDERPKNIKYTRFDTKIKPEPDLTVQDEHVDGVAFCIAYILAFVERYAPDDLEDNPVTEYRESRARSHIERLYIIAPFWEQLMNELRKLYCWENPKRSAAAAMIYFVLWYTNLIPTAFLLMLIYFVLQFRYMPPDESYLHQRVQHRMQRGIDANRLSERLKRSSRLDILDVYKRWRNTYGVTSQVMTGDFADYHEKIKNILLWRNPAASQRTLVQLVLSCAFVTFCSAHLVFKFILFVIGFTFFALMPLQTHYPRYRRPLNPLWWIVLGSPTDAQYAVMLLRQRHLRYNELLNANNMPAQDETPVAEMATPSSPNELRDELVSEPQTPDLHPAQSHGMHFFAHHDKEASSDKIGSFLCQHRGVPGHLIVTITELYFTPMHGLGDKKQSVTPLDSVLGLRKTSSLRFWLWSSNGLNISRRERRTLRLANMMRRDDCFNLLLALGSEVWRKV
ncbi:hypothetical protein MVES1_001769 [Malassezia vespertilionis]|uniref:Uncharacterized protein n=1 Tax=Malassezia vespertilionis TaxID=2020962 RepID=A0A2N1JD37_9BASI|nr:uncharacterized protein MVES1_001769 [Malassezia vespertilionis]PKI84447.1 hypothetical protein MVES_001668 [Malassezia vespertilionis]WFD06424.1 hypothetical protein MVES1_001769 [Malassezia vespertilionis]